MKNPFPTRNANFQAFAAQADPNNQLWRTALGLLIYAGLWLLPVILVGIYFAYGASTGAVWLDRLQDEGSSASTLVLFVFPLLSYPALWVLLRVLHGRSISTLFGANRKINWLHFVKAALITAALASISFGLSLMSGGAVANLPLQDWLSLLPIAIVLIFFQIASEELLFRGYLMQQLGSRFTSRWIWWVLPAFLFSLLHWDSQTFQSNAPLIVVATLLIGLFAGDLTARTGNLGAAMGLHFANNFFAVMIMGMPGPASGLALYLADVDMNDIEVVRAGLLGQIISTSVVYLVYLAIVARRRTGQLQSQTADLN